MNERKAITIVEILLKINKRRTLVYTFFFFGRTPSKLCRKNLENINKKVQFQPRVQEYLEKSGTNLTVREKTNYTRSLQNVIDQKLPTTRALSNRTDTLTS